MENITIETNTYFLDEISKIVYKKLRKDKPDLTLAQYSGILGISERTLYRWNINLGLKNTEKKPVLRMIDKLKALGYNVEKVN